jgi:hypothetical protein
MLKRSRLLAATGAVALAGAGATAGAIALAGSALASSPNQFPAHVFAPYVDTGLSNVTLTNVANNYGTKFFTLAFVDGANCQWSLPNESSWQTQIDNLRAAGGDVIISFGGYTTDTNGTDLGNACSSASAAAGQIENLVTTMNVTHLDFDIESNELTNSTDVSRTTQALAQVRSWASNNGRQLSIAYTIPVAQSGLTQDGVNLLNTGVSNGFTPDVVNIMTMDYGGSGIEMGTAANQALDGTASQVASAFGISTAAAYAKLGNTPMIGQNDSSGEIFTLADASTVESHAAAEGIALLSFWSEGRDNGGCPGQTSASSTCSGISQNDGAFTQAFQPFATGGSSGSGGGTPSASASASASPSASASASSGSGGGSGGGSGTVTNGGFESGSLSPWTCSSADSVTTSPVHSGSYALQGAANDSDNAECSQTISVSPNTTYTLSAWVDGSYVYLGDTGTGTNDTSNWTPGTNGSYQQLTTSFTTGASTTSVTIWLHGWYGQGTYYADDVTVS